MTKRGESNKSYNVTIGDVGSGGQIAVGDANVQTSHVGDTKIEITQADLSELNRLVAELTEKVKAEAPAEKKDEAVQQVEELKEAINPQKPDVSRMRRVANWFKTHIPMLAGSVVSVIVNPIVGKVVEAAGEGLASEIKNHFGVEK